MDGRMSTGFASPSRAAAYVATRFNNIMDMLQLVFRLRECSAVCNIPPGDVLEASNRTRRVSRSVVGTIAAAIHHGLTLPLNATRVVKGGCLA
jgi:SSS family solute:Na+ symporter